MARTWKDLTDWLDRHPGTHTYLACAEGLGYPEPHRAGQAIGSMMAAIHRAGRHGYCPRVVTVEGGAPGFACYHGQDRSALPVLAEAPPDALVLEPGVSMGAMFCQLPVGLRVDRLNLRYLGPILMMSEDAVAELGNARSGWRTIWELFDAFAEALPDPPLDGAGRLRPAAARTLGRFAREAAQEFGPSGFSGSAAIWGSWLAGEHSALSDLIAQRTYALIPFDPEPGDVWRGGTLLGRLPDPEDDEDDEASWGA